MGRLHHLRGTYDILPVPLRGENIVRVLIRRHLFCGPENRPVPNRKSILHTSCLRVSFQYVHQIRTYQVPGCVRILFRTKETDSDA